MDFEYSREWYEKDYHKGLENKENVESGIIHLGRDRNCLKDLGVKRDDKILVCGCGKGDNVWLLQKDFGCENVYGIDWAQPAIDFCRKMFPRFWFSRGNVADMPYEEDSFDKICALDITEHLSPFLYICFLCECRRVLRPGGKMVVLPGMIRLPEHINVLPLLIIKEHLQDYLDFKITSKTREWLIVQKKARVGQ
jgi:ubiquinone/menaquinone biosynthesis C-methylase UbiE